MDDIATTIRDARHRAGLTQSALARRAGTSQPALARYERGHALPTLPTLERLLTACGERLELRSVESPAALPITSIRGQIGARASALRRYRPRLREAARRHGVGNIRVFGSIVRGTEGPESDIDLVVELQPGRTLLDLIAFRREAEEIVGFPVDVATPDMLKERIRPTVMDQARPL
jgi:uncharacterized protein